MASFVFEYVVVSVTGLFVLLLFYLLFKKYLLSRNTQKPAASILFEKERKQLEPKWYRFLLPQPDGKLKRLKSMRRHKVERQKRHDLFATRLKILK